MVSPDETGHVARQRVRRQRPGGDDDGTAGACGHARDLLAHDADAGVVLDLPRHRLGEANPIDRQGGAGRDPRQVGGTHDERAEPPHFFLEKAYCVIELVAAEGVAADELRESVGLVDGSGTDRPHLMDDDRHIEVRGLPCGLAPREAAADYGDHLQC